MNSYYCNSCGNYFQPVTSGSDTCPSCGSSNIIERTDPNANAFWRSKGFIIAIVSLVLMLIVLIILPKYYKHFEVRIDKITQQCKYRIVVTKGETIQDSSKFEYSYDNGKNWQRQNEIHADSARTYSILVRADSSLKRVKEIKNIKNPYTFEPLCRPVNPCDCKDIKIDTVLYLIILTQPTIAIRSNHPKCDIQYSITGENGNYQKDDSTFAVNKPLKPLDIFIKTSACGPIAYAHNPYIDHMPIRNVREPREVSSYPESDVEEKPFPTNRGPNREELKSYLKEELEKKFTFSAIKITFIVESSGVVSGIIVSSDAGQNLTSEVSRLLKDLGGWSQGIKDGSSVNTKVSITFP